MSHAEQSELSHCGIAAKQCNGTEQKQHAAHKVGSKAYAVEHNVELERKAGTEQYQRTA